MKEIVCEEKQKEEKKHSEKNIINKEKIFKITKVHKVGRKSKFSEREGKHNKYSQDNVIRRFKVQFINNLYTYINRLFNINNYGKSKKPINIIKKVNSFLIKSINKEDNLEFLDLSISEFFSQKLSSKLLNFKDNYNEKLIKRIFEKGEEKKVINILSRKIREMWGVYVRDDCNKEFVGFKTLKDDIKKLNELGEDKAYIQMYDIVAKNFKRIFDVIIPRKRRISR